MYLRSATTRVCFVLLVGLFLLTSKASASTARYGDQSLDNYLISEKEALWLALSQMDTAGCVEISGRAKEVVETASKAAGKADLAAERARLAGEAFFQAKEAKKSAGNISKAADVAMRAAEVAEMAAEEADAAAEQARQIAEEGELLGCLEVASTAQQAADDAMGAAENARTTAGSTRDHVGYYRPRFMNTETKEPDWYQEEGREQEVSPMQ